ncbi:hypothetical protein B296_00014042 [Ensete ventricosum]|uniref:Uncharacterized protein n=1 Tax=Ensete ventricosum TaxID=4639 RepID=A0A427B1P7_ENSVE|nr:hypothetical protein B296_00014042 [Ensete ventricosum]
MLTKMLLLVCFLVWKMMASLLSPTAFALGTVNFADYERAHVGIRWTNVWQKKREKKKREKEMENLEIRRCSPDPDPSLAGFSALRGENLRRSREKKTTSGLLAEASQGDFFSPHGLLGEKTFLLPSCIQVRNLHKVYMTREGKHCAVNSLELTLYENQILALLGMLGCAFLFGFFGFHDVTIWMILTYFVGLLEDSLYVVCCVSMKLEHAVTCDGN